MKIPFLPAPQIILLEIPPGTKLPEMNNDLRDSLRALQSTPAFQYLQTKLRLQKAQLQRSLNEGFQLEEKEIRYLQAGIFWLGHIESDIAAATRAPHLVSRTPSRLEEEEFAAIHSSIDMLGA